jgi:hypothetical protein
MASPPAAESMSNETFVELMQQAVPLMGSSSAYSHQNQPLLESHGISSRLVAAVLAIGQPHSPPHFPQYSRLRYTWHLSERPPEPSIIDSLFQTLLQPRFTSTVEYLYAEYV